MNPEPRPIRLLVVDDHNLFRRGLIALLGNDERFEIAGEAADATAAQVAAHRLQPDLILLDNHMPGVQGVDAIVGLKEVCPSSKVVMLTVSENEDDLAAGIRAGADGYLLKTIDTAELCDLIERAWEGDSVFSSQMLGKLVGLLRQSPAPAVVVPEPVAVVAPAAQDATSFAEREAAESLRSLSPRELEILKLIARGDSNKHIARALDIAETTVKIHVQHILRKLNLGNRVHAAVFASARGLA
jgi:two-component system nitrate/nitrite response regulator NarL